jgi:hypothetical protein
VPLRALLAATLLAVCALAAEAPSPVQIRKSAAEVSRGSEVQSKLPTDSGVADPAQRRSRGWSVFGDGFSIPAPAAVFSLIQWALVAGVVIAILALLAVVFREPLESRVRPASVSRAGPVLEPPAPPADPRELLARADRLAAAGQYAEAMHLVLLAAMATLGRGITQKSKDSLTSWEMLRTVALGQPALSALRDLVYRAERAWFGRAPAGPEDYRQARASFDAFAAEHA